MLREKIHKDGRLADRLDKARAAELIFGQAETLSLEVHAQAAVLANGCVEADAEIGIERYRTREPSRSREIAAKVSGHQSTQKDEVIMPGAKAGPKGEEAAFRKGNLGGII
jgi:hypothetical protein